jgi:hypothetical protein
MECAGNFISSHVQACATPGMTTEEKGPKTMAAAAAARIDFFILCFL